MKIVLNGTIDKTTVWLAEDGNWYCSYVEYTKTHTHNKQQSSFIRWCKKNDIIPIFM